jgi:hypothetical protein
MLVEVRSCPVVFLAESVTVLLPVRLPPRRVTVTVITSPVLSESEAGETEHEVSAPVHPVVEKLALWGMPAFVTVNVVVLDVPATTLAVPPSS